MAKKSTLLNKFFANRYTLLSIQILTLIAFLLIIFGGWEITTDNKKFAVILRNTNIANLIVWSYWWPFIIVTAILFGRFWCSICPMELVTSFFGKIGFKRKPGKFLKSGWVITLYFAFCYCSNFWHNLGKTNILHSHLPHRTPSRII